MILSGRILVNYCIAQIDCCGLSTTNVGETRYRSNRHTKHN